MSSCDTSRMSIAALPDLNVLPAAALRTLILAQYQQLMTQDEQLLSREREIEHLKLLLVKLHRMQFGRKSEKLQRQNRCPIISHRTSDEMRCCLSSVRACEEAGTLEK